MPDNTRIGQIVHVSRGYTVAEIVEQTDGRVLGFSVFGHRSDTAMIYPDKAQAIVELNALADAGRRT
jgi:hypothetical protein